jgi:hypothetical protein
MRACVTAAGMALGVVAIWAVLMPLVAWGFEAALTARAFGQGPCGADSAGILRQAQ